MNGFNIGASAAVQRDSPPGDGFLFAHGFAVLSIGWQWDTYSSDSLLGLEAPPLTGANGEPVPGQASVEVYVNAPAKTWALASREHKPYTAVTEGKPGADAVLLVKDYEGGHETVVPRSEWEFGRQADQTGSAGSIVFSGDVVPSNAHVYMESGFKPGKMYNCVYTAEAAILAGAGLLAVRDVACWLRSDDSSLNPLQKPAQYIYAYGNSQTGRMLRHYLNLKLVSICSVSVV